MPRKRKSKLCTRKNEKRKKLASRTHSVSIPLDLVTVLPVSIPTCHLAGPNLLLRSTLMNCAQLHRHLTAFNVLPPNWALTTCESASGLSALFLTKLSCNPEVPLAKVIFTVTIQENLRWTLTIGDRIVDNSIPALDVPALVSRASDVVHLLNTLDCCRFCPGNPDERFMELIDDRKGAIKDASGECVTAFCDEAVPPQRTVRHRNCDIILSEERRDRCSACSHYRNTLRALASNSKSRCSASGASPSSHVNYRYLSTPEKDSRLRESHRRNRVMKKRLSRLQQKLDETTRASGVVVDESMTSDLLAIMQTHGAEVTSEHPPDSFPRIFWEQQLQAAKKSSKGMRWHPLMIRWCINLRHKSSGAYDVLRESGVVSLPSQRTLRDYTHYVSASAGFSSEGDLQLMEAARVGLSEEWQKCVTVILDEMHIKHDLVYDKHSGELIGFANLGEVNEHLLAFEQSLEPDTTLLQPEPLARTMLVIMVRGLFTKLQFPYAQFPCASVSGDLLYDPFWEAVFRIENIGLKVLACTLDGASINRRFVKLHDPTAAEDVLYKVRNPYASDGRFLYFISDPPHLIKTTRNCWSSKSRSLWKNGKSISWRHLHSLYQRDQAGGVGIRLLPKLKYEHLNLTSFSKMRVDLAAQVLSGSVAKALLLTGGPEAVETARFVEIFDKFFDCLNVSNYTQGKHARKPFQDPYGSAKDFRLKWLQDEFLPYLDEWERSVQALKGYKKGQKNRMLISKETMLGLRMTAKSFIELVPYLFTLPGVKSFLSHRLCQDPLERFFGCQRQRGGTHENPNAQEFYKNTQALRVVNSFCRPPSTGNCRKRDSDSTNNSENIPLRKRPRRK